MKSNQLINSLVSGSKGGKGAEPGPRVAVEAPNTLQSKAVLRIVEVISEGEINGLVNGLQSVYLDNTPIQNADSTNNFEGISIEPRTGTPSQDVINGFSNVEEEFNVGVKVEFATPIVRTVTDADTDAVSVTIRIPSLSAQDTSNGDLNGSSVQFKVSYQPDGGSYVDAVTDTITGKTLSPYERSYRMTLTGSAPWNIKVTRLTADNLLANVSNDLYFSRYTRIIDNKLMYPDTAIVGISVDGSLFGASVPVRSYDVEGIKIKVPTNYDPLTRVYTGVWDGTFQTLYSDNPAWVLYDLITNDRYGIGGHVDVAEVDKYGLYTIAQYCDGLVDDGAGNLEPRFTFNAVIDNQAEALHILQTVASVFQGMMYWGAAGDSGIVTVINDMPKDAEKIYNQANVIGGLFSYSGSALNTRHSVAYVTWNDPEDGYQAAIEAVEDADLIEQYGFRPTNIVAYGCTRRSQAHRFGRWLLYTESNETEVVSFTVSLADADVRPGSIIKVQDKDYADVRFGGRITSGTVSTVTLDSSITLAADQVYTIDIVLPNGNLDSRTITDGAGTYSTVSVTPDFTTAPEANAMWIVTATDLQPRQFRVISLTENGDNEFVITALLYFSGKFDLVENDVKLPPFNFSRLTDGQILPPLSISHTEYLYRNGVFSESAVTISWEASTDSRVVKYQLEARRPGGNNNYELVSITSGVGADVRPTYDGLWGFRVRALDVFGNVSPYVTEDTVYLTINSTPPPDVTDFDITPLGNTSELSWTAVNAVNLSHYEIRYNTAVVGATWNTSQVLFVQVPKDATSVATLSRAGSFLIKAVTLATVDFPSGVSSVNSTALSTSVDFFQDFNFVVDVNEHPDFLGSLDNVIVIDNTIQLDITGNDMDAVADIDAVDNIDLGMGTVIAEGTYTFNNSMDLGAVYTSRLSAAIDVAGNNLINSVDGWDNVDAVLNVDGSEEGQWDIQLQVRTTDDDPAGTPTWTEWLNFSVGDYNARAFEFRLKLFSFFSTVTPTVTSLTVTVDMPDSLRSGDNLVVAVNGSTITYSTPFRGASPAIGIAAQNLQQGDYWVIDNKTAAGFDIEFFNSASASVSRTFDYVARGYGFVT